MTTSAGRLSPSSLAAAYDGIVVPSHTWAPTYDVTLGPVVSDLCERVGFAPDPEQRLALDLTFARQRDTGKSAAGSVAVVAARQNLKTGFFKQVALGWLFITDERLTVWSAHEFNTARESFRDLCDLIEASPLLAKRLAVNGIRKGSGDQSIETATGARMIFKTRTSGGGRGLSGRKVILDEAFALQPSHMGALLPLVSAQPDGQILYGSSAAKADSLTLHGLVERGRKGVGDRLAYLEWCAPPPAEACERGAACDHRIDTPGCGCDRPELLRLANPAMGRRISAAAILNERLELAASPEEFGRERMGWHDDPIGGLSPIKPQTWQDARDLASSLTGSPALAFDVQPGNAGASVAAVGRLAFTAEGGDVWRGELTGIDGSLDTRYGTEWIASRLVELATRQRPVALAYDPSGPAGAFRQALLDSGQFVELDADEPVPLGKTRLVGINAREYAQACGALDADLTNRRFRHYDQKPLNDAVEGARTAPLADAWKWSRKDSTVNIAPLVALTLARHGFAVHGGDKPAPKPWAASL